MPRIPLIGGSYEARSVIASAQRCVNYYPEVNPKFATTQVTHYQRAGLVPRIQGPNAMPVRGLYRSTAGTGYACIGHEVHRITPDNQLVALGEITTGRTNPVSFADNGILVWVVDGSQGPTAGWTMNVDYSVKDDFKPINDSSGSFLGATKVDYIDTFMLWNVIGTRNFRSTLSNQITPFDSTYIAGKTDYADLLQTLVVNRHEIILFGTLKSEVWYDAGNALFPFAELPGAYIEHGCIAPYSVATQDISTYWLSQNLQGQGMVLRFKGYYTEQISNPALESALRRIAKTSTISDAIGYTYQQDNHVFYVLTFPSGDQTWVFDESIGDPMNGWHQEAWTDSNGILHRHRGNCAAWINGMNLVGDWENGTIYEMDLDTYTDTVDGIQVPLTCIRTFPNVGAAMGPQGQLVETDGRRLNIKSFTADFEPGMVTGNEALITLRVSRDRGRSWSNGILQHSGHVGDYTAQPLWRTLGVARYPVFELSHALAGPATLNGGWFDADVLEN